MKDKVMSALTVAAAILIVGAVVFIVLSVLGVAVAALLAIIPIVLVVLVVAVVVSAVRGKPVEVEWSFGNNAADAEDDDNDDVISVEDYKELDD